MMKYWFFVPAFILASLTSLASLASFQGAYAQDDIHGSAHVTYRSTETDTDGQEETSRSLTQVYDLELTKEFTPKVNFGADLGINVTEIDEQKTTRLTPDLRLNVTNEYFDANTGYRVTEKGVDVLGSAPDEDRQTTESWNANLSTKSEKFPGVRLRYNEDRNYDHLTGVEHEIDVKTTAFSGGMEYAYRFLNLNCEYRNNILDDYVKDYTQDTDTLDGRVNFRKSFLENKVTTSGSYSITDTKTEMRTRGQEVRYAEERKAYVGLHVQDTTPDSSTLNSVPALIDGNKATSTGINIGNTGNTYHNIGVDLNFAAKAELIFLYTTSPELTFNENNFTWDVYSSDDNITWTSIATGAAFDYDRYEKRFEISFATLTPHRYFKVVNTANDPKDLYVTEIEAYSFTTYAPYTTTETERIMETVQANLGYKPTDWLSFAYDFTKDRQEADPEETSRRSHNMSGRVERDLHKYLKAWAQYRKRLEYDSEKEDRTTDTYLLHFLSSPLKTLDTDLSLHHTVSKEAGETQSKSSSALLQIAAKLREGADLDIDGNITSSQNLVSDSETTTKSIDSNLRLELTRMLTAEIEYNMNWTETEGTGADTTGQTSHAKGTFYWRPSHDFYFRGSYGIDRDHKTGEEASQQQYNMSWLMTEKMQLAMGYTHTVDRNDNITSTYSSDLSWNLSQVFTLRFGYDRNRQETDTLKETQIFTADLSARF